MYVNIYIMTDQEFIKICEDSDSMLSASVKIGISFSTFKRKAKKLNCYKTNQFWNKGKTSISDIRVRSKYEDSIFVENSKVARAYIKSLIMKEGLIEYRCELCEIDGNWMGKNLNLHLDHKNGIRNDNRISNLRFLCPNCHSQTESYCSKINRSITIETYDIEYIKGVFNESSSLTECLIRLSLKDTKSNRDKLKRINAVA